MPSRPLSPHGLLDASLSVGYIILLVLYVFLKDVVVGYICACGCDFSMEL